MNELSVYNYYCCSNQPHQNKLIFLKHFTTSPQLHVQPHELLAEGDGGVEHFAKQHSCLVPKRFQLTNKNYKATQTKKRQFDKQHSCMVPKRFQLTKSLPWNLMTNRQKEAATQGASNRPPAFVTDVHWPGIHLPLPLQASREGEWREHSGQWTSRFRRDGVVWTTTKGNLCAMGRLQHHWVTSSLTILQTFALAST